MDFIPIVWLGLVFVAGLKMFFDQHKLLKLYRREINPPYPIAVGEKLNMADDPFGLKTSMRMAAITFSKHAKHPSLAKTAKKVRLDLFAATSLEVGGFIIIALLYSR